jgi:uncharacterized protein (DUF1778 family)
MSKRKNNRTVVGLRTQTNRRHLWELAAANRGVCLSEFMRDAADAAAGSAVDLDALSEQLRDARRHINRAIARSSDSMQRTSAERALAILSHLIGGGYHAHP